MAAVRHCSNMDRVDSDHLRNRLADLKRRLQQTTDPAAATVISNDIADVETRLKAAESPLDLRQTGSHDPATAIIPPGARSP